MYHHCFFSILMKTIIKGSLTCSISCVNYKSSWRKFVYLFWLLKMSETRPSVRQQYILKSITIFWKMWFKSKSQDSHLFDDPLLTLFCRFTIDLLHVTVLCPVQLWSKLSSHSYATCILVLNFTYKFEIAAIVILYIYIYIYTVIF